MSENDETKPEDSVEPTEAPVAAAEPEPKPEPEAKPVVAAKPAPARKRSSENDLWDEVGRWVAKHGALPALGLITIAIACIHWHILGGEPAGDDLSFHFGESARIAANISLCSFWYMSSVFPFAFRYRHLFAPVMALPNTSAVPLLPRM